MNRGDYIISDDNVIHQILGLPLTFKVKPLIPRGFKKYIGDNLNGSWSQNGSFTIGKRYPVYFLDGHFVIDRNNKPQKCDSNAWGKLSIR